MVIKGWKRHAVALLWAALVTACGGAGDTPTTQGTTAPAASTEAADGTGEDAGAEDAEDAGDLGDAGDAGEADAGGCPFSEADLAQATGGTWTVRGPLEQDVPWLDDVPATTCAFASSETGPDGDPLLVVRSDEVTGQHVETAMEDFVRGCEDVGATVQAGAGGASWCEEEDGLVLQAAVERDERLVLVSLVTVGDDEDARRLRPVLEEVLALVR